MWALSSCHHYWRFSKPWLFNITSTSSLILHSSSVCLSVFCDPCHWWIVRMSQLIDLPDELLYKILGYLSFSDSLSTSIVCKRFHRIIFSQIKSKIRFGIRCEQSDEEFDENIIKEMRHKNREKYDKALHHLSNSYQPITDLVLDSVNLDFDNTGDAHRWQSLSTCLTRLQIANCIITEKHLFTILYQISCLSELHLNNNHYFFKLNKSSSNGISSLKTLRVLSLSGNKSFKLSDALFVVITSQCESLEELDLSGCKIVFHFHIMRRYYGFDSCDHWKNPTDYAFTFAILKAFVLTFGSHLKRLDLSQTDICCEHLVDLTASNDSIDLREVVVRQCQNISDHNIITLKKISPNVSFIY